jgi:hypothetical protein
MMVGIAVFGAYAFMNKPSAPDRTYFEADENGKLQRVERPSPPAVAPPKLWKPEPQHLLASGVKLRLREDQRQRIRAISSAWKAKKASIEGRLAAETSFLAKPATARASLSAIQGELSGYSELSREFGIERELAWSAAMNVLDKEQQRLAEEVLR